MRKFSYRRGEQAVERWRKTTRLTGSWEVLFSTMSDADAGDYLFWWLDVKRKRGHTTNTWEQGAAEMADRIKECAGVRQSFWERTLELVVLQCEGKPRPRPRRPKPLKRTSTVYRYDPEVGF